VRILCVTGYYKPAYVYGGPVKSVSTTCEALARAGNQVTVFTTNANGLHRSLPSAYDRPVEVDGVSAYYYPLGQPFARVMPFYAPDLGRACAQHIREYDVAYIPATWTYAMYAAANSARRQHIPYVVSPRGSFMTWSMSQKATKKRLYLKLVERALIDGAQAIHCTSELEQEQLKPWGFKPPVVIIPNSIETRMYQSLPARGRLRQQLGLGPDVTLSLFVGRLHRMKRVQLMIEALGRLAHSHPNAHLVLVGPEEDGTGAEAQKLAGELGVAPQVHFMGLLTGQDLLQAYSDSDLLLLLSYRENFGMVAVEAMAASLPVLVAHEVGLADEIDHAGAGLAVAAQPELVAQAWAQLLNRPELRLQMGQQGHQLVYERFDSTAVASRMQAMFADLIRCD
jgi:glycosyltransferase involved in cell wall biosynthesis